MGTRLWGPLHVEQEVIHGLDSAISGYMFFLGISPRNLFIQDSFGESVNFETHTLLACGNLHVG